MKYIDNRVSWISVFWYCWPKLNLTKNFDFTKHPNLKMFWQFFGINLNYIYVCILIIQFCKIQFNNYFTLLLWKEKWFCLQHENTLIQEALINKPTIHVLLNRAFQIKLICKIGFIIATYIIFIYMYYFCSVT